VERLLHLVQREGTGTALNHDVQDFKGKQMSGGKGKEGCRPARRLPRKRIGTTSLARRVVELEISREGIELNKERLFSPRGLMKNQGEV